MTANRVRRHRGGELRSSMTLLIAVGGGMIFIAALKRWFDGAPDEATLQRLPT